MASGCWHPEASGKVGARCPSRCEAVGDQAAWMTWIRDEPGMYHQAWLEEVMAMARPTVYHQRCHQFMGHHYGIYRQLWALYRHIPSYTESYAIIMWWFTINCGRVINVNRPLDGHVGDSPLAHGGPMGTPSCARYTVAHQSGVDVKKGVRRCQQEGMHVHADKWLSLPLSLYALFEMISNFYLYIKILIL